MADQDAEALRVTDFTHAWMRRVDGKLDKILEVLVRQDRLRDLLKRVIEDHGSLLRHQYTKATYLC